MSASDDLPPSRLQIAAVISFYMCAALIMVFVNKAVLNSTPDLPVLFLFYQLVIAVLLLHFFAFLSATPLQRVLPLKITLPALEWQIARKLIPFVTVGVAGLLFNTLCLATVDASFFQIARGLLLPMTIVISAIATRKRPSNLVVLAALIVTAGFFVGVSPASLMNARPIMPVTYGTLSSIMLALHAVLIKSADKHVGSDNSVIKLAYYGNLMSAVILIPFIALNGEFAPMMARWAAGGDQLKVFVIGTAITGVFGFMLGVASMLSIKVTSPVTHMFSSATRSVLQTLLGIYFFGDIITIYRASSILVITVGALLYIWVQSNRKPAPTPPQNEISMSEKEIKA